MPIPRPVRPPANFTQTQRRMLFKPNAFCTPSQLRRLYEKINYDRVVEVREQLFFPSRE